MQVLFDGDERAALRHLEGRERPARRLQDRREFFLDEARLLLRVAHVSERWAHVERAAGLALEQHVIAAQMLFRLLAARAYLLQKTVARFALLILLVADGLRVGYLLRHARLRGLLRGRRFFCHRRSGAFVVGGIG